MILQNPIGLDAGYIKTTPKPGVGETASAVLLNPECFQCNLTQIASARLQEFRYIFRQIQVQGHLAILFSLLRGTGVNRGVGFLWVQEEPGVLPAYSSTG
jgi:hypothetical protein